MAFISTYGDRYPDNRDSNYDTYSDLSCDSENINISTVEQKFPKPNTIGSCVFGSCCRHDDDIIGISEKKGFLKYPQK